jgi:H+/Cl- antiporter ClcA
MAERLLQPNDAPGQASFQFSLRFWIMVGLTGIGTGIGAGLLMDLLRLIQHTLFLYHRGDFQSAVERSSPLRRIVVVTAAGVIATIGIWALRRAPGGKAGAIDEAVWFKATRIAALKTLAQGVLSIVIVAMGASLGRESAPKETGAAIASKLAEWAALSPAETRFLTACGAGAGLGAVYNVPLGGALFALEVLLGTIALPLIAPAVATAFIATGVSWLLLPSAPTYLVAHFTLTPSQTIWSIGFGPVAGLAGVAFLRLIVFASRHRPTQGIAVAAPVLMFASLGVASVWLPQLLGNGRGVTELAFQGHLGLGLLFALILLKPLATAGCLGSGAPGGLFTPSTMFGAMLGGALGHSWSLLWPGASAGSYAVIGSAAVLAATMQAPLAAIVLVIELTHHDITIMVPMLIAVAGASVTMRWFDRRSVYTGQVAVDAPEHTPAFDADRATALGIRIVRARSLPIWAGYRDVLEQSLADDQAQHPVYVIDEHGCLVGRITPDAIAAVQPLTRILVTGAAADLMTAINPLDTDGNARHQVQADAWAEVPVVESGTGLLIGVAQAVEVEGGK